MHYTLIDAAAMHKANPDTFERPSKSELARIKAGDVVKVGARFDPTVRPFGDPSPRSWSAWVSRVGEAHAMSTDGERFWVIVSSRKDGAAGTVFTGKIDNDLVYRHCHGLDCGDTIEFWGRHVLSLAPPG